MSNRVSASIEKMRLNIIGRIVSGQTTQEAVNKMHSELDVSFGEHAKFQEVKSLAVLHNKLTADEGQLIYALLGGTHDKFNRQPIEVKVVLTKIFEELLAWKIKGCK